MCRALALKPTNLVRRRRRPSAAFGGAGEDVVHLPHRQLVRRRELALEPVADLDVAGAVDHVAVLLDPLDDLLGDGLGADGALLKTRFQLADARALGVDADD